MPNDYLSPPARVAWIETVVQLSGKRKAPVATREGGVDRNIGGLQRSMDVENVATREGGVDRNDYSFVLFAFLGKSPPARVAWIETANCRFGKRHILPSPPARVAWIETLAACLKLYVCPVATREGGVDRNMSGAAGTGKSSIVATREGGVDRNLDEMDASIPEVRRHPRGWRG